MERKKAWKTAISSRPNSASYRRNRGIEYPQESEDSLVAANKNLLKEVRRLAIKDELVAMRIRGRLVVPVVAQMATGKKG
jgi:hypothetical protein